MNNTSEMNNYSVNGPMMAISESEQKMNELKQVNRSLSVALEGAYKIIEHHEKVIESLEIENQNLKKNVSSTPKSQFTSLQMNLQLLGFHIKEISSYQEKVLSLVTNYINSEEASTSSSYSAVSGVHMPVNLVSESSSMESSWPERVQITPTQRRNSARQTTPKNTRFNPIVEVRNISKNGVHDTVREDSPVIVEESNEVTVPDSVATEENEEPVEATQDLDPEPSLTKRTKRTHSDTEKLSRPKLSKKRERSKHIKLRIAKRKKKEAPKLTIVNIKKEIPDDDLVVQLSTEFSSPLPLEPPVLPIQISEVVSKNILLKKKSKKINSSSKSRKKHSHTHKERVGKKDRTAKKKQKDVQIVDPTLDIQTEITHNGFFDSNDIEASTSEAAAVDSYIELLNAARENKPTVVLLDIMKSSNAHFDPLVQQYQDSLKSLDSPSTSTAEESNVNNVDDSFKNGENDTDSSNSFPFLEMPPQIPLVQDSDMAPDIVPHDSPVASFDLEDEDSFNLDIVVNDTDIDADLSTIFD